MCRITDNLGLARRLAHKYSKFDRNMYEDLYQEACVGLVEANETYDESISTFSTHATNVMQFKLMSYLESNNTPGITSRSAGKMAMKIRKLGIQDKSTDEIAEILGISKERAMSVLNSMGNKISIEADNDTSDESSTSLVNVISTNDVKDVIIHEQGLDKLNDIQRSVFKLSMQGYTKKEIAEAMGVSLTYTHMSLGHARKILRDWTETIN